MSAAATLEVLDLPPLPPPREVPTSWKESIGSWWASTYAFERESAASEERILRRIPSFIPSDVPTPKPAPPVISRVSRVSLPASPNTYLNTLSILPSTTPTSEPTPTVLLHGYGAGLGFFFPNLPYLAQEWTGKRGGRVYAVDWLGMGRSSRVPFKLHAKGVVDKVKEAELFFVDSLEEWRKAQKLEKMALVGHSLGGYLSVAYTLRYPSRVSRLILLSPAGVPTSEHAQDVPAAELADPVPPLNPATAADKANLVSSAKANGGSKQKEKVAEATAAQRTEQRRQVASWQRKMFMYMWEAGWSPFSVLRWSGIYGPLLAARYSTRRFAHLSEEDVRDMHNYIYHITRAKGSGEYCISHILAPGAYAYYPVVNRIDKVKVPVAFVYGDKDWMDPAGGLACIEKLKAAGNKEARMYVIDNAGHHVYLDNKDAVNELLIDELSGKASKSGRRRFA